MPRAKISSKGQITIPKALREALNIHRGDKVEMELGDGHIAIRPVHQDLAEKLRGSLSHIEASLADELIEEHRFEVRREEENSGLDSG